MSSTNTAAVMSSSYTDQANALRALAMDSVQKAKSGHPGAPMGMAEMAVALWQEHLNHNPKDPAWANRDRFVLSNGHASMLVYALLHLSGYDLPIEELQNFRQLHSKTPGHPEFGLTPGVETTTGPLGQGISNAVGFALAEKLLADEFNTDEHTIVDHHTYAFIGDGCLMEGISHEACALAGVWQLDKLIVLYDSNNISIDGQVSDWFIDNTAQRFAAYGWQVIDAVDGHDVAAVGAAIAKAKQGSGKPTLIICETEIGKGSPNRGGTAKAHGEPLGDEEIAATRSAIGWSSDPFDIPASIYADWDASDRGASTQAAWQARFDTFAAAFPQRADEFRRRMSGEFTDDLQTALDNVLDKLAADDSTIATRKASQLVLNEIAPLLPEMVGGSADLTGSNLTNFEGCTPVRGGVKGGRHINYGVREFGMAAIMNGLALHGGFIPYGGTFLTFCDYSRNAIRMAALMKQRVIHVLTHDSIGLGEDGPTHQPVEHTASLRLIPGLDVWRPCDVAETAAAWICAVTDSERPTALCLTRQGLPAQHRDDDAKANMSRGGYVLADSDSPQAVILASGSEVALAQEARKLLTDQGISTRIVSMPSTTVFDRQDADYQQAVLGGDLPKVGVEAGNPRFWAYYGARHTLGMETFGESAPGGQLFDHFGFTAENLAALVKQAIADT